MTADIALIGGGAFGPLVSDRWDCNVYLVRGRDRSVVIDAGAGRSTLQVPADVDTVLLTHLHMDHSGGAQHLAERGLTIRAHPWCAEGLARGDEVRAGLAQSRARGFYPADFALQACPSVAHIKDGEAIDLGGCKLTAIDTPGHCDGHLAYLLEGSGDRAVFVGDLVFAGGTVALQALPDCRLDLLWDSLVRIRGLQPERLYAGHGHPVLDGATAHIDAAIAAFAAGGVPAPLAWTDVDGSEVS